MHMPRSKHSNNIHWIKLGLNWIIDFGFLNTLYWYDLSGAKETLKGVLNISMVQYWKWTIRRGQ